MTMEVITSPSFPAVEFLNQTVEAIFEVVFAAKNVLIEKESFSKLTDFLERIVPVLKELNKKSIINSESLINAIGILNREIKATKQLILECSKRNKVYLLMNCRGIAKRLEDTTREISRALDLIPIASMDLSSNIIEEMRHLCENMCTVEFRAAIAEENILEKIETGIQERNVDRSYANNLLVLIADAVGISTDRSALKKEFEEFKSEIESAQLRKDHAEAIQNGSNNRVARKGRCYFIS